MFDQYTFANPELLWLLAGLVPMIVWYILREKHSVPSIKVSSSVPFEGVPVSLRIYLRHMVFVFRLLALSALVISIARPQSTDRWSNSTTYGIDIMMAVDVSSSMLARDFEPNRLEASKRVAATFVNGRPFDRIGLVVFAGESFTQCPLTSDHAVLLNTMKKVETGVIDDGTAIGMGFATAIARLKESDAKSKTIILLTDGVNNSGDIDPVTAAEIAMAFDIRVYTIGVGTNGTAPYPVETAFGMTYQDMEVEIDEDVLKEIARMTGGKYFRATDEEALKAIYDEIDSLEKSRIEEKQYSRKNEMFAVFALFALGMLVLEVLLKQTVLRNIP